MSDLTKEITEITTKYKQEMAALTEKYLKELEYFKARVSSQPEEGVKCGADTEAKTGNLKEKIEIGGPTYFS
jgi:phage host-nuclease inhibitor protein Gam